MNELALFAGAGGGILGGHLLGWRTVCAVEWEPYPASVLVARQNEGILPPFPIWDDVQTFDGRPWRGIVDVVSGGFPCQDISVAGKGAGIDGERSGMWRHMSRIIGEVRPRFAFVENSPALIRRGLARVIGDLAEIGYDCRWCVMGADDVGAPHRRKRIWILAYAMQSDVATQNRGRPEFEQKGRQIRPIISSESENMADPNGTQCKRNGLAGRENSSHTLVNSSSSWWRADPADALEPKLGRMADGVANRVDRLKAIGNGQVPAVAATAFKILKGEL